MGAGPAGIARRTRSIAAVDGVDPERLDDRPEALHRIEDTTYRIGMCRSIKTLRRAETAATTGELEAAARQFVRKISGYRTPSTRNAEAFEATIVDVAASTRRLLESFGVVVEEGPDPWTSGSGSSRRSTERPRAASAAG